MLGNMKLVSIEVMFKHGGLMACNNHARDISVLFIDVNVFVDTGLSFVIFDPFSRWYHTRRDTYHIFLFPRLVNAGRTKEDNKT